jgi:hypothetical protein
VLASGAKRAGRERPGLACHEQPALVACHQVIGLARFRQSQQEIISGIGGTLDTRQGSDILGELLDLVDQMAGLGVV